MSQASLASPTKLSGVPREIAASTNSLSLLLSVKALSSISTAEERVLDEVPGTRTGDTHIKVF